MFTIIYEWFKSLFGSELFGQLSGYSADEEGFGPDTFAANEFTQIGIITLVIVLVFIVLYYYVFNHPRFNRWWSWASVLISTGITNLLVGYFWTKEYPNIVEDGADYIISYSQCWGFGFANLLVSIIFFVLATIIIRVTPLKNLSRNCRYSPF